MMPSDEELMMKVRDDADERAFETLVQRHRKSILNFVYRFMGDRETAEDLSQDVFMRLWTSACTYLPVAKFTTFLYTIAKNLCLNTLAKAKNKPSIQSLSYPVIDVDRKFEDSLADPSGTPESEAMGRELEEKVSEAIGKLSNEHRMVFVLTEYHGFSYEEVAAIVQCPVGTVASRKNAAIKRLRRRLETLRVD
jgi:RNA polymerase sigma-70 factor (ECF subfamily)